MLLTSLLFAAVLQDAPAPAAPPPLNLSRPLARPTVAAPAPRVTRFKAGLVRPDVKQPAPYETVAGLILVQASISGKPGWALVDTGSARSVIDLSAAEARGLAVGPPEGSIATPSGEHPLRIASGATFLINKQLGMLDAEVTTLDLAQISRNVGRKVDFVLGLDVLSHFTMTVDPAARTLSFGITGETAPPAGASAIPLIDQWKLEVAVAGQPIRVGLDTGSTSTLILNPEAWGRIGPKGAVLTTGRFNDVSAAQMVMRTAEVSEVSVGGFARRDARVNVQPWPAAMGEGALGMGFLAGHPMMIDMPAGKLWLAPQVKAAPTP